jgi:hypothetical protein
MNAFLLLVLGSVVGGSQSPAAPQESLEAVADRFVQAWMESDTRRLEAMLRSSGIRLHLQGEDHLSLPPRQVRAALDGLMDRSPVGEVTVTRVVPSEGDPSQGFADFLWRTGAPGGGGPITFTLFVAFAWEGDSWQITAIRILPSASYP